jgi:AcrR family transcriptional regulator
MPNSEGRERASRQSAVPLAPAERRERNRQDMIEAIVDVARAVMQERGVAALNLNEVARRVRMRPQSLAGYFPTKTALYDELVYRAVTMIREGDEAAYREHPRGWAQIEAWFANRTAIALEHPDYFHLTFDVPVPDYGHPERAREVVREILAGSRRMVAETIAAGIIEPGISVEQATDMLLAIRRGLIAERLGKQKFVEAGSARFAELLPVAIEMIKTAWAPAPNPAASRFDAAPSEGAPMGS